jgi:GH43 family beta-xylosidase
MNHVYTNGSQYILTNDPNYDPNRDDAVNNLNWDRMRRAHP